MYCDLMKLSVLSAFKPLQISLATRTVAGTFDVISCNTNLDIRLAQNFGNGCNTWCHPKRETLKQSSHNL